MALKPMTKTLDAHIQMEGHPATMIKQAQSEQMVNTAFSNISHNSKSIDKLDTNLQREMKLLVDSYTTKIEALDKRLQNEMSILDEIQNVSNKRTLEDIQKIFTWEDTHDKRVVGLNSRQDAELVALRAKVADLEKFFWHHEELLHIITDKQNNE